MAEPTMNVALIHRFPAELISTKIVPELEARGISVKRIYDARRFKGGKFDDVSRILLMHELLGHAEQNKVLSYVRKTKVPWSFLSRKSSQWPEELYDSAALAARKELEPKPVPVLALVPELEPELERVPEPAPVPEPQPVLELPLETQLVETIEDDMSQKAISDADLENFCEEVVYHKANGLTFDQMVKPLKRYWTGTLETGAQLSQGVRNLALSSRAPTWFKNWWDTKKVPREISERIAERKSGERTGNKNTIPTTPTSTSPVSFPAPRSLELPLPAEDKDLRELTQLYAQENENLKNELARVKAAATASTVLTGEPGFGIWAARPNDFLAIVGAFSTLVDKKVMTAAEAFQRLTAYRP